MDLCNKYPILDGSSYEKYDGGLKELYLSNVWCPHLAITGIDDIPNIGSAGNVVRSATAVRLSMRLCPTTDYKKAIEIIKKTVTTDVPYGAEVTILGACGGAGWCMKELSPSIQQAVD